MLISIIIIISSIFIIFCIVALIVFNNDVKKKYANRKPFKHLEFDSKTILGQTIDSSIFSQNKITMVNIWATYCSSCINELDDLESIYQTYQHKSVGILGIVSDLKITNYKDKDLSKAINLIEQHNISYNNIFADEKFVSYATGKLFTIPTTIFVDTFGNVIGDIIESALTKEQYTDIIDKLLNSETFEFKNSGISCTINGKCIENKKS